MNRVIIDLDVLQHNIQTIDSWMKENNAEWTLVTKVLCGHSDSLKALQQIGIRSMADSRLQNLRSIERIAPGFEAWYLRLPHLPAIGEIISLADVSLNSEIKIIKALNEEARIQEKVHRIIVMIELGDLREGILPGSLINFYEQIFELTNIEVLGIGANVGCLSGAIPNIDQLTQLTLYRELLELKFDRKLPVISAGSSAVLPLLQEGKVPKSINHFRIGEAVFLGTDLVNGGTLKGLRNDAITLEANVVEVQEKSLLPFGETTSMSPFETFDSSDLTPGQRGYRAIVTVGQLDTEVAGLTPVNPNYKIAGASSDLTVVNIGEDDNGLNIGDSIKFRPSYGAFVRLMIGKYIEKEVTPEIKEFRDNLSSNDKTNLTPVIGNLPFDPVDSNLSTIA
jgi:ornithine racemase